jgi:cytochrome c oxidase subunit 1/cytochrome c oxidase subunit I+III
MLGDSTAFASLIFGVFFYWTATAAFPPPDAAYAHMGFGLLGLLSILGSWALLHWVRRTGERRSSMIALGVAMVLALVGIAGLLLSIILPDLEPTEHVYPAILWALIIWTVVHVIAGVIMQGYCLAGFAFGKVTARYNAPVWNSGLYWHFLALQTIVTVATVTVLPRML